MYFKPNLDDCADAQSIIDTVENVGVATPLQVMGQYFHELGMEAIVFHSLNEAQQKISALLHGFLEKQSKNSLSLVQELMLYNQVAILSNIAIFTNELSGSEDIPQEFSEWGENLYELSGYTFQDGKRLYVSRAIKTAVAQCLVHSVFINQETDIIDVHTESAKADWIVKVAVRCIKTRLHDAVLEHYKQE